MRRDEWIAAGVLSVSTTVRLKADALAAFEWIIS